MSLNSRFEPVPFIQTVAIQAKFLIGTSSGLLYYDHGRLHRIFDSYFYGITRCRDRWYAFGQFSKKHAGQIISFRLDDTAVEDIRTEAMLVGPGVHQIHAWEDHLYVADTQNNRLMQYMIDCDGLKSRDVFYPNSWSGKNDVHLNSIYCHKDKIYLIYHNRTRYTGRNSQIAVLNNALQMESIIDTQAGSAHNIVLWEGAPMYCDSQAGTLVWNEPVLYLNCFTRGLAIADEFVLVGGSEFAKREERQNKTGYVFAFDLKERKTIAQITIPAIGNVFELRLIEPTDYGMANY